MSSQQSLKIPISSLAYPNLLRFFKTPLSPHTPPFFVVLYVPSSYHHKKQHNSPAAPSILVSVTTLLYVLITVATNISSNEIEVLFEHFKTMVATICILLSSGQDRTASFYVPSLLTLAGTIFKDIQMGIFGYPALVQKAQVRTLAPKDMKCDVRMFRKVLKKLFPRAQTSLVKKGKYLMVHPALDKRSSDSLSLSLSLSLCVCVCV